MAVELLPLRETLLHTDAAVQWLKDQGYRPATPEELQVYKEDHPQEGKFYKRLSDHPDWSSVIVVAPEAFEFGKRFAGSVAAVKIGVG